MRLNALGIVCSDIEVSLDFYRRLDVAFPEYDPGTGHYEAELAGGFRLILDTYEVVASFADGFVEPVGNDVVTFAVECDGPDQVDRIYADIATDPSAAVRPPFDAFWGQRYATVADPDGNHVDLYARLT